MRAERNFFELNQEPPVADSSHMQGAVQSASDSAQFLEPI
jgi:hypothetical protein